jgi:hypothetical protein
MFKRFFAFWILALMAEVTITANASDRLNPDLLKTVVRIETTPNARGQTEIGSGFLFTLTSDDTGKFFLVTNKHMIGDWNWADCDIQDYVQWINVFFYRNGDPSGQSFRATRIDILKDGHLDQTRVHLHPTGTVDLVAIEVTDKIRDPQEHISYSVYTPSFFVSFAKIKDYDTNIADEVIALGYPLGIRSQLNDYPIAKMGVLASVPGDEVSIPVKTSNRAKTPTDVRIDGKYLIVDGLITNGNSGGPVVLVGGGRMRLAKVGNAYHQQFLDEPIQNLVIGVVSGVLDGSGLSVVVSSDYLLDFLDSLAPPK